MGFRLYLRGEWSKRVNIIHRPSSERPGRGVEFSAPSGWVPQKIAASNTWLNVKRAITITGWQRPQLFLGLLELLAANHLGGWDILIQLEPSEFVDDYRAAAGKLSGVSVSITVNQERLGIRIAYYTVPLGRGLISYSILRKICCSPRMRPH